MSEIEEIFASKGKAKIQDQQYSPPSASSSKSAKKKKNKNKATQVDNVPAENSPTSASNKRPSPETVIDSSSVPNKRLKTDKSTNSHPKAKVSRPLKDDEDEAKFKDSRGAGPRQTTEEGWPVYKEDELGIHEEGGDTPLCPFDCDCCF